MPYTLTTDPWFSEAWPSRPTYINAVRVGSAGPVAVRLLPAYHTHSAAMDPTTMPATPNLGPSLTPADVVDLRVSVRTRILDTTTANGTCIRFNALLPGYELHSNGNVLCWSERIEVLGALIRGERYEPGFIRKVLSPDYLPDEIAADADTRERQRQHRLEIDAQARARAEADREAARRRTSVLKPANAPETLSVDDLLNPGYNPHSRPLG